MKSCTLCGDVITIVCYITYIVWWAATTKGWKLVEHFKLLDGSPCQQQM
jgi:hypothetical protein